MTGRITAVRLLGLAVVLAGLARVVHLNADSSLATWVGYIVDEGRWNETARNMALFGTPDGSSYARLHFLLTPGYQLVNFVVFRLLGVDFWSARLFSALSGVLLVLIVFLALRRWITPLALAVGVVVLGFETNLLVESRMALPEVPSVLASLIAFLVLVLGRRSPWNAFVAGLFAAVAVAMKATTILVTPVFLLVIVLFPQRDETGRQVCRVVAFLAGFALLVTVGIGAATALGVLKPAGIMYAVERIFDFLRMTTPYVAAIRFFDSTELEVRNLLLLGAWYCSWLWLYRRRREPSVLGDLYLASGAWAGWWLIAWSSSLYLPGRYVVHFVVPATIHIVAGLSLADNGTTARIVAAFGRYRGLPRAASLAWLALPIAIALATILAGLASAAGTDISRLTLRVGMIAMLAGVLAVIVGRVGVSGRVVVTLLVAPVFLSLFWLGGRELGYFHHLWQFETGGSLALWVGLTALTLAACLALAVYRANPRMPTIAGSIAVASMVAVFLAQGLPAIVFPTYSIRDASRDLQHRLGGASEVRTFSAESMFLANTLRYQAVAGDNDHFDGIVVFDHGAQSHYYLASERARNLIPLVTYPVVTHPRYEIDADKFGPASVTLFVPR